jgi:hypothetical protein
MSSNKQGNSVHGVGCKLLHLWYIKVNDFSSYIICLNHLFIS